MKQSLTIILLALSLTACFEKKEAAAPAEQPAAEAMPAADGQTGEAAPAAEGESQEAGK